MRGRNRTLLRSQYLEYYYDDVENHPVSVGDTEGTERAIMTGAITGNTLISCHRHREDGEKEGEGGRAGWPAWCLSARSGEPKCKNDRRHFFIAGD